MFLCVFNVTVSQTFCWIMKCFKSKKEIKKAKKQKKGEAYSSWPSTAIFFHSRSQIVSKWWIFISKLCKQRAQNCCLHCQTSDKQPFLPKQINQNLKILSSCKKQTRNHKLKYLNYFTIIAFLYSKVHLSGTSRNNQTVVPLREQQDGMWRPKNPTQWLVQKFFLHRMKH